MHQTMKIVRSETDDAIRLAAFNRLAELQRKHGPILNWEQLHEPIRVSGEEILLSSVPRGLFRPGRWSEVFRVWPAHTPSPPRSQQTWRCGILIRLTML